MRSGLIDVPAAGTAVQGPATPGAQNARFTLVAHPGNTGDIYVGNDGAGDVSVTTGVALAPGDQIQISVPNLAEVWFDAENDGNDCTWIYY